MQIYNDHLHMMEKIGGSFIQALAVLQELAESAAYWSEYDVPMGIVDRINDAIAYVGEDGIKPNVAYKLDDNHNFVEANK